MPSPDADARRTIRTFGWASFLHDLGADMVFAVWPLFLTQVLGASKTAVGLVDGLGEAMVSLSQAASGYVSDRIRKRKIFVWIGYGLGAVARVGYAFSPTWPVAVPFRILDRSGKMRGSPRDAIIADASPTETRGRNFGYLRMMDNLGAVAGILLSLVLIRFLSLRTIFLLAAIPSVLASLLVFTMVRERKAEGRIFPGIRLTDISVNLRLYIACNAIFNLGSFSYSFLLLAAMSAGWKSGSLPLFYLLYTVFAAILALPAGRLSDRYGRKPLFALSLLAWACAILLFLRGHPSGILPAFVLYGIHVGILDPVQKTFAAELAPRAYVASTLGGFQLVLGLTSLPASLLAGVLWDRVSPAAPFLVSLTLTALALLLLLFVREKRA